MSLHITSLNSGSNGNCYYIASEQDAILIDAGISCRETEKRLQRLGLSMQKVRAIFVSHEHSDHIKGISTLAKKYRLPVYISEGTFRNSGLSIEQDLIRNLIGYNEICIGELCITPFQKIHDAADPYSFIVNCNSICIGVFTDIGAACPHVLKHFKLCHAAFLEANYDEDMLDQGRYPYYLKNRIRGGKGHLSNKQALDIFISHKPQYMSHLLLSHLSKDNNCATLVEDLFRQHAGETEIIVASRYQETPVYYIGTDHKKISGTKELRKSQLELMLF